MVIDADAINLIAAHPEWIDKLPKNTILTPIPKSLKDWLGLGKTTKRNWNA